jgi:hypothetical protein
MTKYCYLCGSPIEKIHAAGLSVFVACDDGEEHHILCSMCTTVVKEARVALKRRGRVLITQTPVGVVSIANPASYEIHKKANN